MRSEALKPAVCAAGALVFTTLAALGVAAEPGSQPQDHHAQMNARGRKAMGFDQAATTHHFNLYEDGGVIEITVNDTKDKQNLTAIRSHLPHISRMFAAGDFSSPLFVHDEPVRGTETMARLRGQVSYSYEDVPNGGRVRITTRDAHALTVIHEFLRYQIAEHNTGDSSAIIREKPVASTVAIPQGRVRLVSSVTRHQ
jgi:hypothetical protein